MTTTSQSRYNRPGGQYPDGMGHGSYYSTSETLVAELEAPPEIPVRRRATPQHPIQSMQEAFAESLEEATRGPTVHKPNIRSGDAKSRREALLDQDKDDGPPDEIWRFRPGQRCHELRRLVAQISFGVYLLLAGMANNKVDVITILQGHIDEVDEFLETTLEDMALATKDLQDRLQHLRLPMENMEIFEKMLEDRNFRLQIVTGNEMIEHIVSRTTTALLQTEQDVTEGIRSTQEFSLYLAEQQHAAWRRERPDVGSIYEAMKGNTEGWYNAFMELQGKGAALNALIVKLNEVVDEMERRAGEVSRRTRFSIQPYTGPTSHSPRSSRSSTSTTVTPTDSPPRRIPDAPPRLSLRFSSLIKPRTSVSSYFDLSGKRDRRDTVSSVAAQEIHVEQPVVEEELEAKSEPRQEPVQEPKQLAELEAQTFVQSEQRYEESVEEKVVDTSKLEEQIIEVPEETLAETETVEEEPPILLQAKVYQSPRFPPPRSPRRIQAAESPGISPVIPQLEVQAVDAVDEKTQEEDDIEHEAPLFILQPRTYTPQPASPLPSPRQLSARAPSPRVPSPRISSPRVSSPRSSTPRISSQLSSPRISSPRVVSSPRVSSSTLSRSDDVSAQPYRKPSSPKLVQTQAKASPEAETNQPIQRGSLRQRVSLKTSPPQSIQVPPPRAHERQQHPAYASPQIYSGHDSAYASEVDRQQINSFMSMDPASIEIPPTPEFRRPALIPSPHSDQQYFRPVQASPHSPLQQRPHTSHTVTPRYPTYQQQHERNVPSRMGMSMMSNVTTATNETSRTLKKKRSAFGWLKKAFSLDEEERAAFEQKRRDQAPPVPDHDTRAPKFIDGKRIR